LASVLSNQVKIGSEAGIRWKLLLQPNDFLASELELLARLIMGIGPGQAVANGERLLKPLQRFGGAALREQEIAGQQIRDGHIVLPAVLLGSAAARRSAMARLAS
jgi:hypothetical protein